MAPQTCIFLGRSGSGKGTQAKHLIEYLQQVDSTSPVLYIETGQRFRQFVTQSGYSAEVTKQAMAAGGRLPDFLAIWNWGSSLIEQYTGIEHLIFDGAPRSLLEAQVLDTALKYYRREKPIIIYLNVPREWSATRLKERGRSDDNEAEIANRLSWFDRDVAPAVAYYREHPDYQFLDINGGQTIEAVSQEIRRLLTL